VAGMVWPLVAFALFVPGAEAVMRFFGWCMFTFSDPN